MSGKSTTGIQFFVGVSQLLEFVEVYVPVWFEFFRDDLIFKITCCRSDLRAPSESLRLVSRSS